MAVIPLLVEPVEAVSFGHDSARDRGWWAPQPALRSFPAGRAGAL